MSEWTNNRVVELRRLYTAGYSPAEIAVKLGGVSRNAVIGKIHRLGLCEANRSRPWTDEDTEQFRKLWLCKEPPDKIAERLGRTRAALAYHAKRLGLPGQAELHRSDDPNHWDNLTDDQRARLVRPYLERGFGSRDIALQLGATEYRVQKLRKRLGLDQSKGSGARMGQALYVATSRKTCHEDADLSHLDDVTPLRTLSTVQRFECRHVIGDAAADDPAMCGRPVREGAPHEWCPHHMRLFTRVAFEDLEDAA